MLTLYVKYTAKNGCREQFLREAVEAGIVTAIRAEEGCMMYDYYLSAQDENVILLIEQWESEAHQCVHMQQSHMMQLRELKEKYVAETTLGKVELYDAFFG